MKPVALASAAGAGRSRGVRTVLTVAGLLLLGDGLLLMAQRHLNLGVVLPAMLGAAFLFLAVRWRQVAGWRRERTGRERLWRLGWVLLALWLASVFWFWGHLRGLGLAPAEVPPVRAIVVLGSGTLDGQPRPALAARLDTAAELARLQPSAWIAVCGGVDLGETESEAAIMARYLRERHGIAPDRLVLEAQSTSTELNLALSRPLLQARGVPADAPTAVVTSDFHLLRAVHIARRQGLAAVVPVGAPTPITTRYNAWLREYFALASSWALREL
ncbi:YdcF family protein [Acidovorax sp. PRC11]|nr:YdcF family protein [Acidovorax sp. PRC11]MDT0138582.1 YdcF family protein [Acidovorax sp. PRC11]